MRPLTNQEFKELTIKYRVRTARNGRVNEILDFLNSGAKYAELPRWHDERDIIHEQTSYIAAVHRLTKKKEILPHTLSIHVYGNRIIVENRTVKEEQTNA